MSVTVASWCSLCFVLFCVLLCVRAVLSWCHLTWHVYMVYNNLSLNISSIYFILKVFIWRLRTSDKCHLWRISRQSLQGRVAAQVSKTVIQDSHLSRQPHNVSTESGHIVWCAGGPALMVRLTSKHPQYIIFMSKIIRLSAIVNKEEQFSVHTTTLWHFMFL